MAVRHSKRNGLVAESGSRSDCLQLLVALMLMCLPSTTDAERYVTSDMLDGFAVITGPVPPLRVPLTFSLDMQIDVAAPFNTLKIDDLKFIAQPIVYQFPGFEGNTFLTLDEFYVRFDKTFPLTPDSGVFKTEDPFTHQGPSWTKFQYDSFGYHVGFEEADLGFLGNFHFNANLDLGSNTDYPATLYPENYPDELTLGRRFIDDPDRHNVMAYERYEYDLDDHYRLETVAVQYPDDCFGCGMVVTKDYDLTLRRILEGDSDDDGDVDITDFNMLSTNFDPQGISAPHPWKHGNFDGDDDVDITDFNYLVNNFAPDGYSVPIDRSGVSIVPDPSTWMLLVVGILLGATATGMTAKSKHG